MDPLTWHTHYLLGAFQGSFPCRTVRNRKVPPVKPPSLLLRKFPVLWPSFNCPRSLFPSVVRRTQSTPGSGSVTTPLTLSPSGLFGDSPLRRTEPYRSRTCYSRPLRSRWGTKYQTWGCSYRSVSHFCLLDPPSRLKISFFLSKGKPTKENPTDRPDH